MRVARMIVVVLVAALAGVYVVAGAWGALLVLGAQCAFTLRVRKGWLLAVQAGLVYAVTLGQGASVAILGFLAGSLLVTRWWALAPAVVFSGVVIHHWRNPGDAVSTTDLAITTLLMTLVVFGLNRLVDRVAEMEATRPALAAAAVAEERLRIAAELSDGLGRGLAAIGAGARRALTAPSDAAEVLGEVVATARRSLADARAAAAGYRAMSLAPELTTARALLEAAGVGVEVRAAHTEPLGPAGALLASVLREAVTDVARRGTATLCVIETREEPAGGQVRLLVADDGRRTAEDDDPGGTGTGGVGGLGRQVAAAGGTLTRGLSSQGRYTIEAVLPTTRPPAPARREPPDVSVVLLAAVLVGFSVKALLQIPAGLLVPAIAGLSVIVILQLRSVTGRHMVALGVMAALTFAPIPVFGPIWLGSSGFLAGPVLLAFRPRTAWPLVGAILAAVWTVASLYELPGRVNVTVSTLTTGLVVYSLLRLAQLAKELHAARESLARSAVVEERLRAARDLHDLLGHSLAAILLTCELARRLPDPAQELENVLTMAEHAHHDLRSVTGEQRELSFAAEAESARKVLAAAGVEATVRLAHPGLPAEVETVLSAVLREAVTNVLRHSSARACVISTSAGDGEVGLRVRNDGAATTAPRRGSSGLGNLTTRLATLGGRLTTGAEGGWFQLDARAPLDPAGLGGDAHGVGAVARV
ncbi:histidine kinase [Nonomuraea sp. WAC 01424]|uniref:sensor histidine kinase n=1 Tax=Nonomuraea sp. WAC 01424 TaxID=2203200 RepID=UPI001C8C97DD|nr:histidine kinase [Nonomuraea sp. WAC 01424]